MFLAGICLVVSTASTVFIARELVNFERALGRFNDGLDDLADCFSDIGKGLEKVEEGMVDMGNALQ